MPSQSCLQPNRNPHQLPHGWGHRGGPAVPSPSTKSPPPQLFQEREPRRRGRQAWWPVILEQGCVCVNSENKPEEVKEDMLMT